MTAARQAPVVIGHRGVPGERLEHTRPSYLLAIEQGCDYIEPDVVVTKDGVLVVRHENEIGGTTDVAERPEFADRKTLKVLDGVPHTGWFTEDFTLEEIRTLRARERLPKLRPQNIPLAHTEPVLTFDEVVDIAEQASVGRDEPVGVYVETKHPTYFAGIGLDLNDLLVANLERRGLDHEDSGVVIQSKETGNLRALRDRTPVPLVQLLDRQGAPYDLVAAGDPRTYAALSTPEELTGIAAYADGIGPNKSQVIGRDRSQRLTGETGLVRDAHDLGLFVHVWTMRSENNFLPLDLRVGRDKAAHGDAVAEYLAFYDAGVDGVFTDFTQTAVQARRAWAARR
ncbi:glycerophosphodiester phosphodiesterase [Aeromicrobium chenweiae]|uniref:glycerophosphodiester phosphodiesterase n=1 Tax=Aeromicrobium chenweiae TaxID=2079793 RepID=A0A2S0WPP4_9ACTN|nr:glycerophosphodiester phosphodiesterase [Aeromicrobium chenweiae]AWB93308.1 glycerophosphodiester phosphodiesterase [Aeromicrobium chenweiae]TGN34300.1 glycerophosphodiester phosphodiesterase [Aeromicrobium chenweiae]